MPYSQRVIKLISYLFLVS